MGNVVATANLNGGLGKRSPVFSFVRKMDKRHEKAVGGAVVDNPRISGVQPSVGFDRILIEAINVSVKVMLGGPAATAIFYHLEKNCRLKTEDIPKDPASFAFGLEKVFGVGASVIEEGIMKELYSRLGLEFPTDKDYKFVDYVNHAKERHGQRRT